ncbi:MAG TPA: hypothetical protein VGC99_06425 [Candidatus Tectomicrobia bacterium]
MRVVGLFPRECGRGHEHADRVQRPQQRFELAQVRTIVLAIPKAHQPLFVLGLAMHGNGSQVNAGRLSRQDIGPAQVLPQGGLNGVAGPGLRVPQLAQHHRQPIIGAILGADGFTQGPAQAGEMLRGPLFDWTQKVRAVHNDVGEEHQRHFAVAQAVPVTVRRPQHAVNDDVHPHLLEPIDEQRQFSNPFRSRCVLAHVSSPFVNWSERISAPR